MSDPPISGLTGLVGFNDPTTTSGQVAMMLVLMPAAMVYFGLTGGTRMVAAALAGVISVTLVNWYIRKGIVFNSSLIKSDILGAIGGAVGAMIGTSIDFSSGALYSIVVGLGVYLSQMISF